MSKPGYFSWQEAPSPEVIQDATHVQCLPVTYPAAHKDDKMTHHGQSGSKQLLHCVWWEKSVFFTPFFIIHISQKKHCNYVSLCLFTRCRFPGQITKCMDHITRKATQTQLHPSNAYKIVSPSWGHESPSFTLWKNKTRLHLMTLLTWGFCSPVYDAVSLGWQFQWFPDTDLETSGTDYQTSCLTRTESEAMHFKNLKTCKVLTWLPSAQWFKMPIV